jgi:hypothetical protein
MRCPRRLTPLPAFRGSGAIPETPPFPTPERASLCCPDSIVKSPPLALRLGFPEGRRVVRVAALHRSPVLPAAVCAAGSSF